MAISAKLREVYASAPTGAYYVETLELAHPAFAAPFYINNGQRAWTFALESGASQLFSPVPFRVTWPNLDGKGQQDMQLEIDNIGRDAMDALEAAAQQPETPIAVTVRVYLNQANSRPQNDPPLRLSLNEVHLTNTLITGVATRAETLNATFPRLLYASGGPEAMPGLDR